MVRSGLLGLLGLLVGCALLGPFEAGAQIQIIDVYVEEPVSLYNPQLLLDPGAGAIFSTILPAYLQRPMDDLTPRPGAQALGMGGAQLALARGAMALGWNPAALGLLRGGSLFADGFTRASSGNGTGLPDTVLVENLGDFSIRSYDSRLGATNGFGFLGGAAPLIEIAGRPLVGGAAYRRHTEIAYGEETLLQMGIFTSGTSFPFALGIDNKEKGAIESYTVGLGIEAIRTGGLSLSLGSTANFLTGRLRSDVLIRAAVRNFDEGTIAYQCDYRGLALELGALATFGDWLNLAAWASLPHSVEVTNSRLTFMPLVFPEDDYVVRGHIGVAGYDMELPLFTSFGVALGPFKGVELAADLNLRPWSETEIKHHAEAFAAFDTKMMAEDVSSVHVGARFEFPFFRRGLEEHGLQLMTQVGRRSLPLSMQEIDLLEGEAPYYLGDQVEGDATSIGFTLYTQTNVTLHLGMEFQSYEFNKWFLNDAREGSIRELGFRDEYDRVTRVSRSDRILRFSSELHL